MVDECGALNHCLKNFWQTPLKIFKIALSDHFFRLFLTRVLAFIYKPIFNFSLISPHP